MLTHPTGRSNMLRLSSEDDNHSSPSFPSVAVHPFTHCCWCLHCPRSQGSSYPSPSRLHGGYAQLRTLAMQGVSLPAHSPRVFHTSLGADTGRGNLPLHCRFHYCPKAEPRPGHSLAVAGQKVSSPLGQYKEQGYQHQQAEEGRMGREGKGVPLIREEARGEEYLPSLRLKAPSYCFQPTACLPQSGGGWNGMQPTLQHQSLTLHLPL